MRFPSLLAILAVTASVTLHAADGPLEIAGPGVIRRPAWRDGSLVTTALVQPTAVRPARSPWRAMSSGFAWPTARP